MKARYDPFESFVAAAFYGVLVLCGFFLYATTLENNGLYFSLFFEYKSESWKTIVHFN